MPHVPASQALARFRVIDLTQVRAGPTAARQLADWGADVIQVQMPEHMRGDDTLGGQEGSDYQYTHRNKRSITLDLKQKEGHRRAEEARRHRRRDPRELPARREDAPGHRLRRALEDQSAARVREHLGFGQTGPTPRARASTRSRRAWAASCRSPDCRARAAARGASDRGPVRGIFAAYGVTVALLEREASGKGQWLHTSLLEAQVYMMDFQTSRWTIEGEIPGQAGNYHPTSIPTGVYKTKDGHINIAVFGGKIWERFAEAMGAPEWIEDERSKTKSARSVHRDWLNAEIEKRLKGNTSAYWIDALNKAGVACGRINNIKEVFEEPQVKHLGMLKKVTSKWLGRADADGATRDALAHAFHHRASGAETRRAHRRDPGRARLRCLRARATEVPRSFLMNDMAYKAGTERVKTWLEGQVLHIRFNNPEKHNALSVDMWEAVPPLLDKAAKDDNVRMVVLSGEGGKAFVSGRRHLAVRGHARAKEA
jgi:formyl-CoA transferase